MSPIEILPVDSFSDGDATLCPPSQWTLVNPPTIYLEKLGALWAEKQGITKTGVRYYLDQLPSGYRLYERPRPSNDKIVDKHLWGHPHKFFDSPNRFWPHFAHLQEHKTSIDCPCTICNAKGGLLPPKATSGSSPAVLPSILKSGRPPGRPPGTKVTQTIPKLAPNHHALDEERVPDTIRGLINQLKRDGIVDEKFEEVLSIDWRAERDILPLQLKQYAHQKSWLPRAGEIVLFLRNLPNGSEVCLDNATHEYKIWSNGQFAGHPSWEAGIIGQVPDKDDLPRLLDAIIETEKSYAIGTSGYRVEPLADPNNADKSSTQKYKYIPLRQIRPFGFWQEYLRGIAHPHPSIENGLKAMASIALIHRQRFRGQWPAAVVYCGAVFIGAELICVGDTVRLTPTKNSDSHGDAIVEDVLKVESIKLKFSNLDKASGNDYDDGHPYSSSLHVVGKGFTVDAARAISGLAEYATPSIDGYDNWYWLHHPTQQLQVSFTRILGRCFEAEPMLLWFPSSDMNKNTRTLLNYGLAGVVEARRFSSTNDNRIGPGKAWFWADSRAEALDIPSLNHAEVSYFDDHRDDQLDEWRQAAKVLERATTTSRRVSAPLIPHSIPRGYIISNSANRSHESEGGVPIFDEDNRSHGQQGGDTMAEGDSRSYGVSGMIPTVVIPSKRPYGAKRAYETLDDEDSDEKSILSGWIKPTTSRASTNTTPYAVVQESRFDDDHESGSPSSSAGLLTAFKRPKVIELD